MYYITPPQVMSIDDDDILKYIRRERVKLLSELEDLRKRQREIKYAITAKKKSLRRNAMLEKLRKKTLREWR